jgi:hypothetical protein
MDGENIGTPKAFFQAAKAAYTAFWGEDVETLIATEAELTAPPPSDAILNLEGLEVHVVGASDPPEYLHLTLR